MRRLARLTLFGRVPRAEGELERGIGQDRITDTGGEVADSVEHAASIGSPVLHVADPGQQLENDVGDEPGGQHEQQGRSQRHVLQQVEHRLLPGTGLRSRLQREPAEQQVDHPARCIAQAHEPAELPRFVDHRRSPKPLRLNGRARLWCLSADA